jgi:hypothetical protein
MADSEIRILLRTIRDGRAAELEARDWEKLEKATGKARTELEAYHRESAKGGLATPAKIPLSASENKLKQAEKNDYQNFVNEMASVREASEKSSAKRRLDMEHAQQKAISDATQRAGQQRHDFAQAADAHVQDFRSWQNQPKPPPLPNQGGIGQNGIGRFVGGVLGMGGLAVGGTLAGITAVAAALHKVIEGVKQWFDAQRELRMIERQYQTIADRIESVNTLTRRITLHNQELALSYSLIERSVKGTSAAVAHLNELADTQINNARTMAELEHQRNMARIKLHNLFNPIGQLKANEAENNRFAQQQMDQESAAEQKHLQTIEAKAQLASERKALADADAATIKEAIPNITALNRVEQDELKTSEEKLALLRKRQEAQRDALVQISQGTAGPMDIRRLKGSIKDSGELPDADLTALLATGAGADAMFPGSGIGAINTAGRQFARNRIATLDARAKTLRGARDKEQQEADASASQLKQATDRLSAEESTSKENETLRQEAERDAQNLREVIQERKQIRQQQLDIPKDTRATDTLREILQSNPAISSPGGPLGAVGEGSETLQLLRQINSNMEQMKQSWQA